MIFEIKDSPIELFGFSLFTVNTEYDSIISLEDQLTKFQSTTKSSISWDYYIPFGDLDVIIAVNGFTQAKQFIPRLTNIKNANSLRAFQINTTKTTCPDFESPLYALLFLKIDEQILSKFGLECIESSLLSRLDSILGNNSFQAKFDLFATLGWFELFAFVNFASFDDLAKIVYGFRNLESELQSSDLIAGEHSLMQSTVSIPMVKCTMNHKTLSESCDFPNESIESSIRIACKPKFNIAELVSFIKSIFGCDTSFLFGPDDIVFRPGSCQINKLFQDVMKIRSDFHTELLYTKTCLVMPDTFIKGNQIINISDPLLEKKNILDKK